MKRLLCAWVLIAASLCGAGVRAQPGATVLHIATERLTDLALGYRHFPQVARLGFGSAGRPWHAWFGGGVEMLALVHLPDYKPGTKVSLHSSMFIGNRFGGKVWDDAFAALASFDSDGNGIVEGRELRELYFLVDFDGNGTIAQREDALRPITTYYTGLDLRAGAKTRSGHARTGRIVPFSVFVTYASRIHLLELDVSASYASRHAGYLAHAAPGEPPAQGADHALNGWWQWKITNADQWKDATRPWGKEAGGQLLLRVDEDRIRGLVQTTGPHEDRLNLPLQGTWREGRARWTSVSPLGLTRSDVRLDSLFGYPLLRARSWSNRNGKVQEWTWEARYVKPLD